MRSRRRGGSRGSHRPQSSRLAVADQALALDDQQQPESRALLLDERESAMGPDCPPAGPSFSCGALQRRSFSGRRRDERDRRASRARRRRGHGHGEADQRERRNTHEHRLSPREPKPSLLCHRHAWCARPMPDGSTPARGSPPSDGALPPVGTRRWQAACQRMSVDGGGRREGPPERALCGSPSCRLAVVYPSSTATPLGPEAPVMKLWFAPVPSRFARPIVFVPRLAQ